MEFVREILAEREKVLFQHGTKQASKMLLKRKLGDVEDSQPKIIRWILTNLETIKELKIMNQRTGSK